MEIKGDNRLVMHGPEETEKFGRILAEELQPGDIIALVGDLGTGKTTLSKAIGAGLGVQEPITSPTFTIVHEYKSGRLPLYHFDVYRLSSSEDMYELGFEDYFFGDGVCIVEWADIVRDVIPEGSLLINIEYGENEEERIYNQCILQR